MVNFSFLAASVLGLAATAQAALPTLSITGSKFFLSDGNQFYVKGVAYQLTDDDPLVDTAQCQRDAALMQQLGANSIRVYHVDSSADHSGCMNAFAAAGIYLWVDLDSFKTYIRFDTTPSWTQNKSDSYRAVMDNFQQYSNTAGFFVGNEVLNSKADSSSAPYLLAAKVDLEEYGKAKGYRTIPIGYSATDTGDLRPMLQDYVACRPNATERLDFYALNSYEWCGDVNFETSGYVNLQNASAGYPIPIFFSETGCNTVPPRTFADQAAILGPDMDDTWSGAIIYEWIEELNEYGLIEYGTPADPSVNIGTSVINGFTRGGQPTPIQPDFNNLKSQWATLNPSGVNSAQYAATVKTTPRSCPSTTGLWTINALAPLPTLGASALSGASSSTTGTTQTSASSHSASGSSGSSSSSSAAGIPSASLPAFMDNVSMFTTMAAFATVSFFAMVCL